MFLVDAAEAGLEEVDERELQQAQLQTIDLHGAMISSGRLAVPLHRDRRPDRRRQNRAGRAARHAARRDASCSKKPTIRSSPTSTPTGRAPRSRRSSSICSTVTASRPRCARRISSARSTICDYLFDKDKIFAYLNLDDNELFIYQRLYDLLARDVPPPDLVVYLQAPTDVLLRRVHSRRMDAEAVALQPDDDYLRELNEAYHHFFFHYNATPLLVVETSQFDSDASDEALDDLIKQIRAMGPGTRYYVPRTK